MNAAFRRIAIVNRGESAMRLIRAVRELNNETDFRLTTIALYTEPDQKSMLVREADEAVSLGPATLLDAEGQRKSAYLNYAALEQALTESRAEAVWVGWGFVAEHPEFVDLCTKLDIVFIGPDGDVMRKLGDKISSKRIAEEARVPVAAWSGGPVDSIDEVREHARRIGYPLMIKATAGGGGRGIRAVRAENELEEAYGRAGSEALKGFGNATVFMERLVQGARHVEVQVVADHHDTVWAVGVRDCSVQRRNQKLVEESSSPVLDSEQAQELKDAAVRLCRRAGYRNAGTVEFLYDPAQKSFAFMEVNARLQVEHPVTEQVTGLDLVKTQIRIARGERLEGEPPSERGHAVEVRLNAEDPDNSFAPAPGRVEFLRLPTGPGIRVDTGIEQGDVIPAEFDSMIAKIIAHGNDRVEALARLRRALAESSIVVQGGCTNKSFLLGLLSRDEVVDGSVDVGWLDRDPGTGDAGDRPFADLAVIQAAIDVCDLEFDAERRVFLTSAARGRPKLPAGIGRTVELRHCGNAYRVTVYRLGRHRYRIHVGECWMNVTSEPLSRFERRLSCGDHVHRLLCVADGVDYLVEADGVPHRISRDDNGIVRSPAPAVVVELRVAPGEVVERGQSLAVLEAMKLEMHVTAPFSGQVRSIEVASNEQVDSGAPIMRLKPLSDDDTEGASARIDFQDHVASAAERLSLAERCAVTLEELQFLVLGFDIDPATAKRLVEERRAICDKMRADDPALLLEEDRLLAIFADLAALSRREPEPEPGDDFAVVLRRSPRESLVTYLRALDAAGEGLSAGFVDNLSRALAHYSVESLEHTPELEEVLLWIYKSHARVEQQIPVILSVLERRLERQDELLSAAGRPFRELLDRVISVSQGRFPTIADLGREVRYEYFEKPLFEQARQEVYERIDRNLDQLAAAPEAYDRDSCLQAIVQCPQPLMNILSDRFTTGDLALRQLLLESLTRRYYRIRNLENVRIVTIEGHSMATGEYDHEGKRVHVVTTHAETDNLSAVGGLMTGMLAKLPVDHDVVLDFYTRRPDDTAGEDEALAEITTAIDQIAFPRRIRRIVASVAIPGQHRHRRDQMFFTLRPTSGGYREETLYRGIHPMMAKRLRIWTLSNFDLQRLPSAEDVFLFRGVARENPKDERLFALAEVRDLTPMRNAAGKVIGLPHLERMLLEAMAAIRMVHSGRPLRKRIPWNRILLYVWPPLELEHGELDGIVSRLAPATRGLGLEKVVVHAQMPANETGGELRDIVLHISNPGRRGVVIEPRRPTDRTVRPLTPYRQKVVKMRQRGLHYPYEVIRLLAPARDGARSELPPGEFLEHDLDQDGGLVPVAREPGQNTASIVVGIIRNFTEKYPEGMERVIVLGDPSRSLGSLAEPECARIIAALDLAAQRGLPLEWFAVSAGAKISMQSGTENMDWIALVLRRLVHFTQDGGEVNIVVHGINVGAQPYWNAEATMLMHTRGILVMTYEGAMVLTGKRALDYSGSVSAEDNFGIGGYDRIMGPNGQAQYWAEDIDEACKILLRHYEHGYVALGERFPRMASTADVRDRDVCAHPYGGEGGFETVGQVFSEETNPGRKRPFDVRHVMKAVVDMDHEPLERWATMQDAEIGVVWDAHIGGHAISLIGFESRPRVRAGFVPADGPDQWSAGTLFPQSSKKVARAINAATGSRPVVVLANLSGFDGSPESMRRWQLEYGAEIGRAIVNFRGPIVFCVISRYHGGAFVVFSKRLSDTMEVAALEHTFASVIGGAPAAAVVFARDVDMRTKTDPRIVELDRALAAAPPADRAGLQAEREERYRAVYSEKLGEVADEFDSVHSIERALEVGSVDRIVPPQQLRPYLIDAVERGMHRVVESESGLESATTRGKDGEEQATRANTKDDHDGAIPHRGRRKRRSGDRPVADDA